MGSSKSKIGVDKNIKLDSISTFDTVSRYSKIGFSEENIKLRGPLEIMVKNLYYGVWLKENIIGTNVYIPTKTVLYIEKDCNELISALQLLRTSSNKGSWFDAVYDFTTRDVVVNGKAEKFKQYFLIGIKIGDKVYFDGKHTTEDIVRGHLDMKFNQI